MKAGFRLANRYKKRHERLLTPGGMLLALLDLILLAAIISLFYWAFVPGFPESTDQMNRVLPQQETDILMQYEDNAETATVTVVSGLGGPPDASAKPRFIKIGPGGEVLDDSATNWNCVRDQEKNLIWEVKPNDGSWRDAEHTYSWYRQIEGEPASGKADGGSCLYINCDTQSYVREMRQRQLCGYQHWRLPTQLELQSLDHPVHFSPDIDRNFFPFTRSAQYWTGSENQFSRDLAWSVDFANGISYVREKRLSCHLRLVVTLE